MKGSLMRNGVDNLRKRLAAEPKYFVAPSPRETLHEIVAFERRARTLRFKIFDSSVINDSAWLIVQDLYLAFLEGRRVQTKELYSSTELPQTTVLRYLDHLEKCRMVRRGVSPDDSRMTLVSLTAEGESWMNAYYASLIEGEDELATEQSGLFELRRPSVGPATKDQ